MLSNTGMQLRQELIKIWDDRDFVNGVMTNAGSEEAWGKLLDYIFRTKETGESVTSDEIILLSLYLDDQQEL